MMLKGVVDSPDIPLNESCSDCKLTLRLKKKSRIILPKSRDKFKNQLFTENRADFEQKKKWE
jgi:molecular chaperone HtpG